MDKNELRPSRYGALDLFVTESDRAGGIITPELKLKAENSIGSVLETPVYDYDGNITIGNTRELVIADSENNSRMLQINFATYSFGFTVVPAMFSNQEIPQQADFERKMLKYIYKLGEVLDTACLSVLSAAKTKVFLDLLNYTQSGNIINCPWAQRENIIGDINPMMAANDYFAGIHLLGNGGIESLIRKLAEKDIYNSENKTLEYSDKILHFTPRLTNAAGKFGTAYAIQEGMLGILARFEREAQLGTVSRTGHEWGKEVLPVLNLPVGTYYYESVGDFNAIAGAATADMDRARKQHFGFSIDLALLTAYNSAPNSIASPIMKLDIAKENAS